MSWPLKEEYEPEPKNMDAVRTLLMVLDKERECDSFMPWIPGFSPKEHVQLKHLEVIRRREDCRDKEQREWQAAQRKDDLDRQSRVRQEDLDREAKRDADKKASDAKKDSREWRQKLIVWGLGSIIALAAVLFGYLLNGSKRQDITFAPENITISIPEK